MESGAVLAITLVLVLLHFVLWLGFGLGAAAPDLLTLALLLNARRVRAGTAACIGFALGVLADAFALVNFGANALAMSLVGILGVQTRALIVSAMSRSFHFVYFAVGKWSRDLVHWVLQQRAGHASGFVDALILDGVPAALYAASVGVLLVMLVGLFGERKP